MAKRLLLVVIVSLFADAGSAGPLRRFIGRPRACRSTLFVQPPHVERVTPATREQQPVTLRLKFDMAYRAEFNSDATHTTTVMGQVVTHREQKTYSLAWTPRGMTDAGHSVMEMEFRAFKMNIDIGGVTIAVDTMNPPAVGDKVAPLFAAAVGAKVQFHVTPLGNIVAVVGAQELARRLADSPLQAQPLIHTMFSRDALTSLAEPFFEGLPKEPVRPGDVWSDAGKLPTGGLGDYDVETRLRYTGRRQGLDRIEVSQRLAFRPREGPLAIPKTVLSGGAGTGERIFDAAKGRFVAAELQQTFAGTAIVEMGGKEFPVGITSTRMQRIRTSD